MARASERLAAVLLNILEANRAVWRAGELAPDLAPELTEVAERLGEGISHIDAAAKVIEAKLGALREHGKGGD